MVGSTKYPPKGKSTERRSRCQTYEAIALIFVYVALYLIGAYVLR